MHGGRVYSDVATIAGGSVSMHGGSLGRHRQRQTLIETLVQSQAPVVSWLAPRASACPVLAETAHGRSVAASTFAAALVIGVGRSRRRRRVARHAENRCRSISQVLELFSGIGGMRVAFERAWLAVNGGMNDFPRWRAMEVDETCCEVYAQQFGAGYLKGARANKAWEQATVPNEVWRCSIDKMPAEAFEGADFWLMSPPCQPFTRTGHKLDIEDPRTQAFLHLLEVLPTLKQTPRAIFIENVPEFVGSKAHARLLSTLSELKFDYQEHVLDPTDSGFPNTRKRFYCCARLSVPGDAPLASTTVDVTGKDRPIIRPVREFRPRAADSLEVRKACAVPEKLLSKADTGGWSLDVATGNSLATKTFTASYGKPDYGAEGLSKAGPLVLTGDDGWSPADEERPRFGRLDKKDWSRVRYFSPSEMLLLQGYPSDWELPRKLTVRQQWRLVGNSVNVDCIEQLLTGFLKV